MPFINIKYDFSYMDEDNKHYSETNLYKDKIFFDIIDGFPPPPSLPFIAGMSKEEIEQNKKQLDIPIAFSHPIKFLIGAYPYREIREFDIQLYIYPKLNSYDDNEKKYFITWDIAQREKNNNGEFFYLSIWEMKKYIRLYKNFFPKFTSPSDYAFLAYLFLLNKGGNNLKNSFLEYYDKTEVKYISYAEIIKFLFPELSYIFSSSYSSFYFSTFFKKKDFSHFRVDKKIRYKYNKNDSFHISNFHLKRKYKIFD